MFFDGSRAVFETFYSCREIVFFFQPRRVVVLEMGVRVFDLGVSLLWFFSVFFIWNFQFGAFYDALIVCIVISCKIRFERAQNYVYIHKYNCLHAQRSFNTRRSIMRDSITALFWFNFAPIISEKLINSSYIIMWTFDIKYMTDTTVPDETGLDNFANHNLLMLLVRLPDTSVTLTSDFHIVRSNLTRVKRQFAFVQDHRKFKKEIRYVVESFPL